MSSDLIYNSFIFRYCNIACAECLLNGIYIHLSQKKTLLCMPLLIKSSTAKHGWVGYANFKCKCLYGLKHIKCKWIITN